MRIYAISNCAYNYGSHLSPVFMPIYHGEALRLPGGLSRGGFWDCRSMPSMELVISDTFPEVILPFRNGNLVVGKNVAGIITKNHPSIYLHKVNINRVIHCPYDIGDTIIYDSQEYRNHKSDIFNSHEILHYFPDSTLSAPDYYEISSYNHWLLCEHFALTDQFDTLCDPTFDAKEYWPVSMEMYAEYLVIRGRNIILHDSLFHCMEKHLMNCFFGVVAYDFRTKSCEIVRHNCSKCYKIVQSETSS